jgi:uncharacterized protein YukE
VLSLLESSKSYESKGREFHECGRQLSRVLDKLRSDVKSGHQTFHAASNPA